VQCSPGRASTSFLVVFDCSTDWESGRQLDRRVVGVLIIALLNAAGRVSQGATLKVMAVTPPDSLDDARDVDFDVHREWVGSVVVLTARGDLDALTAPHLAAAINRGLRGESTAVVVNLLELDFLASIGMSVLLAGREAAGSSKRFAVAADGSATSRPMKLMGLDQLLSLHPTLEAAMTDITEGRAGGNPQAGSFQSAEAGQV
jgi:anti-anti-sigma factor